MNTLFLLLATSLSAHAAGTFNQQGYSTRGYTASRADAQVRANAACGRRAVRVSGWAERTDPRYITRCYGRAEDKVCDDYLVAIDYTSLASFRCR